MLWILVERVIHLSEMVDAIDVEKTDGVDLNGEMIKFFGS